MLLPVASITSYLDHHSGAATVVLTAVLVIINAYYGFQNWQLRRDARREREESIRPKLVVDFYRLAPAVITLGIRNVGPGVAFAIDVTLTAVPHQEGATPDLRRWRGNILTSGEHVDFLPSGGEDLSNTIDSIPQRFERVTLSGSMKDAEGRTHIVEDEIANLADWRTALHESGQRFTRSEPEDRLAHAMTKPIEDIATRLGPKIDDLTRAVYRLRPAEDEEEA
jgi:hypothetical protein